MSGNILVVGTGTIGEPLIGMLASKAAELDLGSVLFYKRTPLEDEVAKVESLCSKGAQLVVKDIESAKAFVELGHTPSFTFEEALAMSEVVIDCTPAGNKNKEDFYKDLTGTSRVFVAQGSESGFGVPYAYGINDEILDDTKECPRFIQVVSCNTHNIACLIKTLTPNSDPVYADFVCIRRANDISQDGSFVASPTLSSHSDDTFGTHHAKDVDSLFGTVGRKSNAFSSALKVNSQYMHTIRFSITIPAPVTKEEVIESFQLNPFVALTYKTSSNKVFSFGRDHGEYGRIYNQAVVSLPSLHTIRDGNSTKVSGFCFTPQDGNSLLSSAAVALYGVHGDRYKSYLPSLGKMLFDVI